MTGSTSTIVVGVGYVGSRVLEALPGAIGLNRSAVTTSRECHRLDLDTDSSLPLSLPPDYRVLYTVAPSQTDRSDVRLEHLLRQLDPAPRRFVYISTTGVYGDRQGELVDESAQLQPATDRAKRRAAAESTLQAWSAEHGVRLCILRAPGIYGPGRLGIERIRARVPIIREEEASPGNRIHVDDLARCCIAALKENASTGVFNVGDGDARSSTWFTMELARQAGLAPPPEVSLEQARREFSPMRLSFLAESRRVDTTRMRTGLDVTPRYANAEDGIRESLLEESSAAQG